MKSQISAPWFEFNDFYPEAIRAFRIVVHDNPEWFPGHDVRPDRLRDVVEHKYGAAKMVVAASPRVSVEWFCDRLHFIPLLVAM